MRKISLERRFGIFFKKMAYTLYMYTQYPEVLKWTKKN